MLDRNFLNELTAYLTWAKVGEKGVEHKIVIIFSVINSNMCFECSKEPSQWDGSFEYPQHVLVEK